MAERVAATTKKPEAKKTCSNSCKQHPGFNYSGSSADRILQLQRTAGNQAVQILIKSGALQAKLRIGQPNDIYEQEADRVAEQVMRMPNTALQRKCPKCDKDEKKILQVKELPEKVPETQNQSNSLLVNEVLRSPGQPLDLKTRTFMEPRFGYDFSQVRVHTDVKAAKSAREVNALAYTVGKDVVFGKGLYETGRSDSQKLLAHELAHTIQQGSISQLSSLNKSQKYSGNPNSCLLSRSADQMKSFASPTGEKLWIARQELTPSEEVSSRDQCIPDTGFPPTQCSAYSINSWWLPFAYVNNATCACIATPDSPTANCVRKFLQDRLAATPLWLKTMAALRKPNDNPLLPETYRDYQVFVQAFLTPRIYRDHVDAYASCCCPFGPAPYPAWIGVTTAPIQPCSLVGLFIRYFGSCHGTRGVW